MMMVLLLMMMMKMMIKIEDHVRPEQNHENKTGFWDG